MRMNKLYDRALRYIHKPKLSSGHTLRKRRGEKKKKAETVKVLPDAVALKDHGRVILPKVQVAGYS